MKFDFFRSDKQTQDIPAPNADTAETKTGMHTNFFSRKEKNNEQKTDEKINLSELFGNIFKKKETNPDTIFEKPPELIDLPPFETDDEILDRYWLTPPFAYANIYKDKTSRIHYQLVEPLLNEKEFVVLEEVYDYLRSTLIFDESKKRGELTIEPQVIRNAINLFYPDIDEKRRDILSYYLNRNFLGYGKIDGLMHDERIEDITCNGADIPIFLYHRSYANVETNCTFSNNDLNKYVLRLAQKADKQLSLTTPIIDAALPDGSRAQITYSDIVSSKGSSFTIRKFKSDPMTPADLIASNTYDAELMAHIWLAVENRSSLIIVGGTASGKTSTMNAVSFFIPAVAKIVSIEDTREIQLPHINWLSMRTRESPGVSSVSDITMFSLLKASLRQRPEFIIVGEVRGEEAQTLFQAMNTGHTTYSTLHAGNVNEAINRLINDPINVPIAMFGALELVIVQGLLYSEGKGFRRCLSLNEIYVEGDTVKWNTLFEWNNRTDKFDKVYTKSKVFDNIAYKNGWSAEKLAHAIQVRKEALTEMANAEDRGPKAAEKGITGLVMTERELK